MKTDAPLPSPCDFPPDSLTFGAPVLDFKSGHFQWGGLGFLMVVMVGSPGSWALCQWMDRSRLWPWSCVLSQGLASLSGLGLSPPGWPRPETRGHMITVTSAFFEALQDYIVLHSHRGQNLGQEKIPS